MKLIFFLLLIYIPCSLFGQDKKTILTIGSSFHPATSSFFGEVGVMRGELIDVHAPTMILHGQRYTAEVSYLNNNFFIAPKIGYELNLVWLSIRLNTLTYTNFQVIDWRLRPEVGFTFLGFAHLMYGVNIPLTTQKMNELAFHQFSLTFNLDTKAE